MVITGIIQPARPTGAVDGRPPRRLEISLEHPRAHERKERIVEVEVGGKTYPFVFDSAAGVTLITPEVAKAVGCVPHGRITGFRAVDERSDGPRCEGVRMVIGGLALTTETGVSDVNKQFPPGSRTFGGVLSLQPFQHNAVTIDLGRDRLTVESARSMAERVRRMSPLAARLGR